MNICYAESAGSAGTATHADTAGFANEALYAYNAGYADNAGTAGYADYAYNVVASSSYPPSPPASPLQPGSIFFNTSIFPGGKLQVFNGSAWETISSS